MRRRMRHVLQGVGSVRRGRGGGAPDSNFPNISTSIEKGGMANLTRSTVDKCNQQGYLEGIWAALNGSVNWSPSGRGKDCSAQGGERPRVPPDLTREKQTRCLITEANAIGGSRNGC